MSIRPTYWLCLCFIAVKTVTGDSRRTLRVTTILTPPFTQRSEGGQGLEGYIVDLLEVLEQLTDYNFELRQVADGKHGTRTANGQWNGMIGELLHNVADVAAGPLTVTDERADAVDLIPFMDQDLAVLLKSSPSTQRIHSVRDLARQTDVKYGMLRVGMISTFFKQSTDPDWQSMWREMEADPVLLARSYGDGLQRVIDSTDAEPYAFILDRTAAALFAMSYCDLEAVYEEEPVFPRQLALAVSRGSDIGPRLEEAIQTAREKGLLQELYCRWWVQNAPCPCSESRSQICQGCVDEW